MVTGIITPVDIDRAKETAIDKIKALKYVNSESITEAIKWIEQEDTIFGPSDVDKIIENIK